MPSPPASSVPPITAADTARNIVSDAPAVSGVTELERIASRTPTKPAKKLQSTKLRITTMRTFTPASAAPCLLPPTAIVYMPQRVRVSSTCTNATNSSAQISSEYCPGAEDPRERADVVDLLLQRDRLPVDHVGDVLRRRGHLGARHRDRLRHAR